MKTILSLIFTLALISCGGSSGGGGSSSSPSTSCGVNYGVVGTWQSITANDTVVIGQDCSVTSSACESTGKFAAFSKSNGVEYVTYSLNTSNQTTDCESPDSWICAIVLSGGNKSLNVDCENSQESWSASYTK